MKKLAMAVVFCGAFGATAAMACPDFSGKYQENAVNGNTPVEVMTIQQSACASMVMTDSSGTNTLLLDGVMRKNPVDATEMMSGRWDGDTLVVQVVEISATSPTSPPYGSGDTRVVKTASGDLNGTSVWRDDQGNAVTTIQAVYTHVN